MDLLPGVTGLVAGLEPLGRTVLEQVELRAIAANSHGARNVRRTEDYLFRDADLVFVTSERLRERVRRFREQVDVFLGVSLRCLAGA